MVFNVTKKTDAPAKENKAHFVNVRVTESTYNRLTAGADRSGVTMSKYVVKALEWVLEEDEKALQHVPRIIEEALPRRRGAKVIMPKGRIMPLSMGGLNSRRS